MRVLQTKERTAIIECTYEELNQISGKMLYKSDIESICDKEKELPLGKWVTEFKNSEAYKLKAFRETLQGMLSFYDNRIDVISELQNLKER